MSRLPVTILSAAAAAAFLIPAVGAGADSATRDRDHDRMPDRWEKRHHLKVSRHDARGDRDRDGLRNLAEYKAGLDPRDKDSDDDGIKDGAEDAGTIVSFAGGVLTIKTYDNETIAARVTSRTEIECEDVEPATVRWDDDEDDEPRSDRDDGDREDHDDGDRDDGDQEDRDDGDRHDARTGATGATGASDDERDDAHGQQDHDDDDDGDKDEDGVEERDCSSEALVAGGRVQEAKLAVTSAGRVWTEIELGLAK